MDNQIKQNEIIFNEDTLPVVEGIADSMPGGFFIYYADEEEKLIYYNNSMLRIFGCDTKEEFEELVHNSFRGIVHPDDLDHVEHSIQKQIRHSEYHMDYVEYRIIKKDGSVRWVEDYGHFAHTSLYGDVFYVFIEDATERLVQRKSEQELETKNQELKQAHDREMQYKKAILQNSALFFEVNLSKDRFLSSATQVVDGRVVDVFEYIGIPPITQYSACIDVLAKAIQQDEQAAFRHFLDVDRLIRCYQKGELEQLHEAWTFDYSGRRKLGQYAILLGKQEYTGDIIALAVGTDITEQLECQNLLQTALQQAQSANQARSSFLANMSHDIRTPLNAVLGYTDLILNCCSDPKVLNYAAKIKEANDQLLSVVDESMEVTWVESGKAVLTETQCNITDLIHDWEMDTTFMARKKKLTFTVDSSGIEHEFINADVIRLKEIVSQLLDNAVKYTQSGGQVHLLVKEERIEQKGYSRYVFQVKDNGIGIPDSLRENLFQAFVREKNTTMSKVLGVGLGLTVVKTFIDMMEGTIAVDSKIGEGSTFTVKIIFRLDESSEDALPAQIRALDRSELLGKRILLVEDNEFSAEIAEALLIQSGFVVEIAENGLGALEKVTNSSPGYYIAVLMDIQMPVMDGYEATRRIRALENSELANIPIIALSANAFSEDQAKSLECGMDAHFPKPIRIASILDLLCRVLA